jgi:hypothetical protein
MKRTGNVRVLRGEIAPFGDGRNIPEGTQILDGVRKGIGYRVKSFKWMNALIVQDSQGGNADGVAWLALSPCTDLNQQGVPNFGFPMGNLDIAGNPQLPAYQIAWTFITAPSYGSYQTPYECIDPDHIIFDQLYIQARCVYSGGGKVVSYVIELEEYEINANEQILYQIQAESQRVTNPD